MKKRITITVLALLLLNFHLSILPVQAYTDLSSYRIKTGSFENEKVAQTSLTSFKNKTGWSGTIEESEKYQNYYQVFSGGFPGEDRVKGVLADFKASTKINATHEGIGEPEGYYEVLSGGFRNETQVKAILQDFKKSTNINASYFGVGEPDKYYQVISGGFIGEDRVQAILQEFKSYTGINATYEGFGDPQKYYEIISGGFIGEQRVQQVLKDFKQATGIDASYEGIGEPEKYYEITSGGFRGEARIKQVLKEFKEATRLDASYIKAGEDTYKIKTSPILGKTDLKKAANFFISHNWWYSSSATGKEGYKSFRIRSVPVLEIEKVNKGLNFFEKNNWYVKFSQTGDVRYERFRIISDPILSGDNLKKAENFFANHKWYFSTKATGEVTYAVFKIKTEPLLGLTNVDKAKSFFTKNKWYVSASATGQVGFKSFRIVTDPILGLDKVNKAREYFIKNNWYVTYKSTGQKSPTYQIVTEEFNGYDQAQAAIKKIKTLFGWAATAVKTKSGPQLMYTDYGLSLGSMLDKQMALKPQTDLYRNEPRYVHASYVDMNKQIITGDRVNLRTAPSNSSTIIQQLNTGDRVIVIGKTGDWVEVRLTWQNALAADVKYYLDPTNFSIDSKEYFQFLKLSNPAFLDAAEVNQKILRNKGILSGKGQSFIDAAKKFNINEIYLISHSLLETGNGTSSLANGVVYNGKKVYNMYGYGAKDSCPIECGAKTAYENGWFTPEAAIIGGAQFISSGYIYNNTFQQDTLYKMRWNPVVTWHQYATDIGWAYKQINNIYNLYKMIDNYTLYFDVPSYR